MNLYDIAYGVGLVASAPIWLLSGKARRKVSAALRERMADDVAWREGKNPAIMIHAVSVGELNATPALVAYLSKARPGLHFVISTTTETGYARALELYGKPEQQYTFTVIRYPLDFTDPVAFLLDNLRPSVVVLMELEVWPNFMRQCARRNIPVLLANGRITEPSFRKYKWMGAVGRRMFRRLSCVCVQDRTYAQRFTSLGVREDRVRVVGTMKFDNAPVADEIPGDKFMLPGSPATGRRLFVEKGCAACHTGTGAAPSPRG